MTATVRGRSVPDRDSLVENVIEDARRQVAWVNELVETLEDRLGGDDDDARGA